MSNWNWNLIGKLVGWGTLAILAGVIVRFITFANNEPLSERLLGALPVAFFGIVLLTVMTDTVGGFWGGVFRSYKAPAACLVTLFVTIYLTAVGYEQGFIWWTLPEVWFAGVLAYLFGRVAYANATNKEIHSKEWLAYGVALIACAIWVAIVHDEKGILSRILETGLSDEARLWLGIAFGAFLVAFAFGVGIRITGAAKNGRAKDVLGL